jgi:hypothetical protein
MLPVERTSSRIDDSLASKKMQLIVQVGCVRRIGRAIHASRQCWWERVDLLTLTVYLEVETKNHLSRMQPRQGDAWARDDAEEQR